MEILTKPLAVGGLALLTVFGLSSSDRTVSSQGSQQDRMAVVVSDEPQHLQMWRATPRGYEKAWEATPRVVDSTWGERRTERIAAPYDGGMKIADANGDGSNELVVGDGYGIAVYGRTPAYYSFPAAETTAPRFFTIADVDGDGAAEIVTQRFPSDSDGEAGPQCEIEVLKVDAGNFASIWKGRLPGDATGIFAGDVDNDGAQEVVSGSVTAVTILERRPGPKWEVVAELPLTPPTGGFIAGDKWLQVADVDGDGKNEIIVGGSSGKLTVFKSSKMSQRVTYPVLWQSANLMAEGMTARPNEPFGASCLVSSVVVADVDGDGRADIVAGTGDYGRVGQVDISGGRLHVFRFNGRGDFTSVWLSEWIKPSATVSGIADVDGDGANEVVVNGSSVYKRDGATNALRPVAALLPTGSSAVVGPLPDLQEPSAVRIVPLYWTLPGREVEEGVTLDVAVTLRNVWSEAKDVTVTATAEDAAIEVRDASFRFPSIPASGIATTTAFKLTGRQSGKSARIRFDVTAANGYRQSVTTSRIFVLRGTPTYLGDVESHVAVALARARDDNKRVLIQWGSNTDPAATTLISMMRKDADVANTLVYEYEVVRADVKGAERASAKYKGTGATPTVPYFTILDAQGKVLASQSAAAFKKTGETAAAYDTKKLNTFLAQFKPTYPNAEPLLTEALSQAKKDQKTLFLYFSAPT